MTIAFPGESADYRAARDRLLDQEIKLPRLTEAMAVSQPALPTDGPIPQDHALDGVGRAGAPRNVKLSELFRPGKPSLAIYNLMFPRDPDDPSAEPAIDNTALLPLKEGPCPSCTALLDQLHDAAEHATQHINLAVLANTSLPRPLTFAQERGWRHLRLPSPAANTYNRVFHRDQDTTRHFWSSNSSTPQRTAIRTRVTSAPSSRSTGRGLAGAQGCHRVIASSC